MMITIFPVSYTHLATIVICPGGGYGFTSDREAEPIALKFMAQGFNAIVLRYSVAPARYPNACLLYTSYR